MDSQLTLVDVHSLNPSGENIILIFDRDDMQNTTLRLCGTNLPSYSVRTLNGITTVCAGDCLLAVVTRRTFWLDQITFPGLRPIHLRRWLKAPILSSLPLAFRTCGRRLKWLENSLGQLVLYDSVHPSDTLARFSRSRGDLRDPLVHAACLAIKPEMIEMRDMIVLSCLLAEHKLRALIATQGKTVLDTMVLGF